MRTLDVNGTDISGTDFAFVGAEKVVWRERSIPARKSAPLALRYLDLAGEFTGGRIVELAIDQGASTCFRLELLHPVELVAVDINPVCPEPLSRFLAKHEHSASTPLDWGSGRPMAQ